MNQPSYASSVLNNVQLASPEITAPESLTASIIRCAAAGFLALLLALATVFRDRLGATLKFTRSLELGSSLLRQAHSGHPWDYVAWLAFGTALLGGMFVWFLQ
jgi:hypothetical protein